MEEIMEYHYEKTLQKTVASVLVLFPSHSFSPRSLALGKASFHTMRQLCGQAHVQKV